MVGQAMQNTPRYGATITTVDPAQGLVAGVMKGDAQERQFLVVTTPLAFRWPQVGESWMVEQKNGTWYLDGLWPEDTFQDVNPGDMVLNSPTGAIHVLGSSDGSTDFSFDAANFATTVVAAPTGIAATDTANINVAIAATGSSGTVRLGEGNYFINAMLIIPDGITLLGGGASHQFAATTITCTTADSGVTFNGRGGPSMGVRINGNGIANFPWVIGAGLDRTFINISSAGAALDGVTVNSIQNTNFIGCGVQNAARDGLVLDLGCGGLVFERFENTSAGRYPVHIQQSGPSPSNAYPAIFGPAHIKFSHCIFERPLVDNSLVRIDQGTNLYFDTCVFSRGQAGVATSPLLYVADYVGGNVSTRIELRSCLWGGQTGTTACIHPGQSQLTVVTGANRETGGVPFIDGSNASAVVYVHDMPDLSAGGPMFTAGTPTNGQNSVYQPSNIHRYWQLAVGNLIARNRAPGESFDRMQWFGSGTMLWGSGGSAPDTTVQRLAPGTLGISNVLRPKIATPAYGAPTSIDATAGEWQTVTVTNGSAFAINPNTTPSSTTTQTLTIEIFNNWGGAMGAITWNAAYVFAGLTWTNPASTKKRFVTFKWNGTAWIAQAVATADYS